jgi:hypothetical protein
VTRALGIRSSAQALAASLLLSGGGVAVAEPPTGATSSAPAGPAAGESQVSEVKGGFLSSLKQAFQEDPEREVVWGHFDVGTPPDTHRFYCLIDPKTGKKEANAVAGQPVHRRDGMTGIKGPAVSPLSCADAEAKGVLITAPYAVKAHARAPDRTAPPAPNAAPVPAPPVPAAMKPPESAAAASASVDSLQTEVMAVYARFIAGQNARDRAAVSETLLDSKDFVWVQGAERPVVGHEEAMAEFARLWKGTWKVDPQTQGLRVSSPAPGVAVLTATVLLTAGAPGTDPLAVLVRWSGVFVETHAGWRLASIFVTPTSRGP